MDPIWLVKQFVQLFYMSAIISIISGHGLSIDIHCGIKVFHLLTAACHYVSYLSGGPTIGFFSVFCMYVPCAVKMFHLLTAACQYMVMSILVCAIVPGFRKSGHTQTHTCIWWMSYCTYFMFNIILSIEAVHRCYEGRRRKLLDQQPARVPIIKETKRNTQTKNYRK